MQFIKCNINLKDMCFLFICMYSANAYCNIIWPAAFIGASIFSSLFLIIISIIIEAVFLKIIIENISYFKALLISFVGNAISATVGTVIMMFSMLPLSVILGGAFGSASVVASYIFMYIGSCLIELYSIKLLFGYSTEQLRNPVFIGNLVTYVLVYLYKLQFYYS